MARLLSGKSRDTTEPVVLQRIRRDPTAEQGDAERGNEHSAAPRGQIPTPGDQYRPTGEEPCFRALCATTMIGVKGRGPAVRLYFDQAARQKKPRIRKKPDRTTAYNPSSQRHTWAPDDTNNGNPLQPGHTKGFPTGRERFLRRGADGGDYLAGDAGFFSPSHATGPNTTQHSRHNQHRGTGNVLRRPEQPRRESSSTNEPIAASNTSQMLCAFSISPIGVGESVSEQVAEVVRLVRESDCRMRPTRCSPTSRVSGTR